MKVIVGLGNPGVKHEGSRHNVGFEVVDRLIGRDPKRWSKPESRDLKLTELKSGDQKPRGTVPVVSAVLKDPGRADDLQIYKPLTFMNESGKGVRAILEHCGVEAGALLIICDDVSLQLGQIRLRRRGSSGGHQGLESILAETEGDFSRLRIGIGHPGAGIELAPYVLERFQSDEKPLLDPILDRAAEAARMWYEKGIDQAMNQFNQTVTE